MNLNDILRSQGGLSAIASQLGISEAQAEQGAGVLLPAILGGFGRRAESGAGADAGGAPDSLGGLGGLGGILGSILGGRR